MFNPPALAHVNGDRHSYEDQGHPVDDNESHGKGDNSTNENGVTDSAQPIQDKERHEDRESGERPEQEKVWEPQSDLEEQGLNSVDYGLQRSNGQKNSPSKRIIPIEEDIRRLFQECKIGRGNAALLSEALVHTTPEDLDVIVLRSKCVSSQELIVAQIPWATAGAERSRREMGQQASEETTEEKLLGDLLAANEELMSALKQYEDLVMVGMLEKAEEQSEKDAGGRGRRASSIILRPTCQLTMFLPG
ncbi:hypothetical protein L218DRAFT_221356 [Marasmius fiardii PR-910]|nr:hypothetical protein L218DRAFT_221356 [Marasmius fiardii PR-910]